MNYKGFCSVLDTVRRRETETEKERERQKSNYHYYLHITRWEDFTAEVLNMNYKGFWSVLEIVRRRETETEKEREREAERDRATKNYRKRQILRMTKTERDRE